MYIGTAGGFSGHGYVYVVGDFWIIYFPHILSTLHSSLHFFYQSALYTFFPSLDITPLCIYYVFSSHFIYFTLISSVFLHSVLLINSLLCSGLIHNFLTPFILPLHRPIWFPHFSTFNLFMCVSSYIIVLFSYHGTTWFSRSNDAYPYILINSFSLSPFYLTYRDYFVCKDIKTCIEIVIIMREKLEQNS